MSEKNAYTGFIDMMSKKATEKMPTYFRTGTVKNGEDSGNLSVSIGGIEYTKRAGEVMKFVSCAGCGLCASCRACQYNTFSGECKMKIKSGDKVLCLTTDNDQSMIILCKIE